MAPVASTSSSISPRAITSQQPWIIIISVLGSLLLIMIIVAAFYFLRIRRRPQYAHVEKGRRDSTASDSVLKKVTTSSSSISDLSDDEAEPPQEPEVTHRRHYTPVHVSLAKKPKISVAVDECEPEEPCDGLKDDWKSYEAEIQRSDSRSIGRHPALADADRSRTISPFSVRPPPRPLHSGTGHMDVVKEYE